ncbi:MAG TPA: hypothetical protein VGJ30_19800 [Candidatus Angelobacter sp.]
MVRLIPSSPRLQIMDTQTGQDGHFVMANLAPGNYRILAAPLETDSEDEDADFGKMNIVLTEKESKTVEINMDKAKR